MKALQITIDRLDDMDVYPFLRAGFRQARDVVLACDCTHVFLCTRLFDKTSHADTYGNHGTSLHAQTRASIETT